MRYDLAIHRKGLGDFCDWFRFFFWFNGKHWDDTFLREAITAPFDFRFSGRSLMYTTLEFALYVFVSAVALICVLALLAWNATLYPIKWLLMLIVATVMVPLMTLNSFRFD